MYYNGRIVGANIYCRCQLSDTVPSVILGYLLIVEVEVEYRNSSQNVVIRRSTSARSNAKSVRRARRRARKMLQQIQNWVVFQHYPASFDASIFMPV